MRLDPFRLENDHVALLDQTLLPGREEWIPVTDAPGMADAIARLRVRGAPAIGIAAGLALALEAARGGPARERMRRLEEAGRLLRSSRPTAVNLAWAVERVLDAARASLPKDDGTEAARAWAASVRAEALSIWEEDRAASRSMASHGATLLSGKRRFLTHCHTGGLATGGGGTAFAVLQELHRLSPGGIEVWATETRPLLQGARLTTWELKRAGIPAVLITDSAAAHLILREGIEGILVGADRIARNGDTANKVGTLGLALAAREAGIPFVVVAPSSTIDATASDGTGFVIEERDPAEVFRIREVPIAPEGVRARNPAFDVTPARWIDAVVTEQGVFRGPPYSLG